MDKGDEDCGPGDSEKELRGVMSFRTGWGQVWDRFGTGLGQARGDLKYYVFANRKGREAFWTGEFRVDGRPKWTRKLDEAISFNLPSEAYAHCKPYRTIWNWRVGHRA